MPSPTDYQIEMIIQARDEARKVLAGLNKQLREAGGEAQRVTDNIDKVARRAREAGVIIATAFAQRGLLRGTVGTFQEIEDRFINVAKTANLSASALDDLKGSTRDLVKEMRQIPLEDFQRVQAIVGQMGIESVPAIQRMTEAIVRLQNANESLRTDEAAANFARFTVVTKTTGDQVLKLASALTQLDNSSVANADQILNVARVLKQSTSAYKFTADEILGVSAAAVESGLRAELVGSVLGKVITGLDLAASANTDGMDRLVEISGVAREEWQKMIKDNPTAALMSFLKAIKSTGGDMSTVVGLMQELGLYAEENRRVVGILASQYDQLNTHLGTAASEMESGQAIIQENNRRLDAQVTAATNAANALALLGESFGEAMKPVTVAALNAAAEAMNWVADTLRDMNEPLRTAIALGVVLAPTILAITRAFILLRGAMALLGLKGVTDGFAMLASKIPVVDKATALLGGNMAVLAARFGAAALAVAVFYDEISQAGEGLAEWLGLSQGAIDFLAMDPFTGTIQWGENAGKNFWTGVREYTKGENGEWIGTAFERMTKEQQNKIKNAYAEYGASRVQGQKEAEKAAKEAAAQEALGIRRLTDEFEKAIQKLDTFTDAMADLRTQAKALDMLQSGLNEGLTFMIGDKKVDQEYIDRLRSIVDLNERLADPAKAKVYDLGNELKTAQATTQAAKDQLEIEEAIRDVLEQKGILREDEIASITNAVRALQEARKAAVVQDMSRELQEEIAIARERTSLGKEQLEIDFQLAALKREHNITDEKILATLRKQLETLNFIQRAYALEDSLDPILAANRQYMEDLATINRMREAGLITSERQLFLTQRLEETTRAQRDPLGERIRLMQDQLSILKLHGKEADIEKQVQQEINQLRQQGVKITDELTDAMRRYVTAVEDAEKASSNGLQAWADAQGDFMDAIGKWEMDAADGFADAIVGALHGESGSFVDFFRNISRQMTSLVVRSLMQDLINSTGLGANPRKDEAIARAEAAAKELDAIKQSQIIEAQQAVINAATVNIPGLTDGMGLPGLAANDNRLPSASPNAGMSVADQYASYGAGRAKQIAKEVDTASWEIRKSIDAIPAAIKEGMITTAKADRLLPGGLNPNINPARFAPEISTSKPLPVVVQDVPGQESSISSIINSAASRYGVSGEAMRKIAWLESKGNPMAKNPNSSAGGLFQFINSTAGAYGLKDRYDPKQAADAMARLTRDNQAALQKVLGREPSIGELYLAHQQGIGGAKKLLSNPNSPAWKMVGKDAVRLNAGRMDMTSQEFANMWINKANKINQQQLNKTGLGGTGGAVDPQTTASIQQLNAQLQQTGTAAQQAAMATQTAKNAIQSKNSAEQQTVPTSQQAAMAAQQKATAEQMGLSATQQSAYAAQMKTQAELQMGMATSQVGVQVQTAASQAQQAAPAFQQAGASIQMAASQAQTATPGMDGFGSGISGLLGPLAQVIPGLGQFGGMIMQLLQSLFSGGMGGMGGLAGLFHEGGEVGSGHPASGYRMVSAAAMLGANRYHDGLGNDEFAAVLQRGERVLTKRQNRSAMTVIEDLTHAVANQNGDTGMAMAGGRGNTNIFNMNIQATDQDSIRRSRGQTEKLMATSLAKAQARG